MTWLRLGSHAAPNPGRRARPIGGALFAPIAGKLSDRRVSTLTLVIAMAHRLRAEVGVGHDRGPGRRLLLLDLGVQSTQVAAQSEVMALVPVARSRLKTIYRVVRFIGDAVGSAIGTFAYARSGWTGTCAVSILILLLGTAVLLMGMRRRGRLPAAT